MTAVALIGCNFSFGTIGKILALWLIVILRYNLRSKYYVFNKNTVSNREQYIVKQVSHGETTEETKAKRSIAVPKLDFHEAAKVLATIDNPAAKLRFET